MLCVGYDDAKQSFIVRNSWGSNSGVNGFVYMPYSWFTTDIPNVTPAATWASPQYTIDSLSLQTPPATTIGTLVDLTKLGYIDSLQGQVHIDTAQAVASRIANSLNDYDVKGRHGSHLCSSITTPPPTPTPCRLRSASRSPRFICGWHLQISFDDDRRHAAPTLDQRLRVIDDGQVADRTALSRLATTRSRLRRPARSALALDQFEIDPQAGYRPDLLVDRVVRIRR